MSAELSKLVDALKVLFQLDNPDLDFGFYRIMHAKSVEVSRFLEEELSPQVRGAFGEYRSADKVTLQRELDEAVAQARSLGADPDTLPKVKALRERLENDAVDVAGLEAEVYDHLFSFFRRYYSEGDFLSRRVYKAGVYAIPYEGEEVKLHWANADQYYIKTSEYLRDYAFRLKPDDTADPMRVRFRLVDAAEGEHGNVKEAEGRARVFVLQAADFIAEVDGEQGRELEMRFEYRPATLTDWPEAERTGKTKPPAPKDLLALAETRILATEAAEFRRWLEALARPHLKADGETAEYSRLRAHLNRYAARNTFDYFIHKDLGGFLRRELDFYIKNEVMHLDDIEQETAPRVEQYLSKIKVIRKIAGKIIEFLTQLEEFQKKLWLKKKLVVETSWLIRVGCIPEEFYPEIVRNDAQREEWVKLLAIDQVKGDLTTPGYSVPLSLEFLKAFPTLVVDTRHFDAGFVHVVLGAVERLDVECDGTLLHADNFQGLRLLQRGCEGQFRCVYIDPPYNAATSEILYKNTYKHSSWLSLMQDRCELVGPLLASEAVFVCAIDENEQERLGLLLEGVLPSLERVAISVVHNPRGIQGTGFSFTHESAYFLYSPGLTLGLRELAAAKAKPLMKTGSESARGTGRNCFYPIRIDGDRVVGFGDVPADGWHPEASVVRLPDGVVDVWPISSTDGIERKWRYSRQSIESVESQLQVRSGREGTPVVYLAKDYESYRTVWSDAEFNAAEYGSTLLKNVLGSEGHFSFPKSLWTVWHSLKVARVASGDQVLDFFAGSGTTGHAVINLNREDGGDRKFILVEMGEHFDTVLVPRLKKVTFGAEWKDGKPKRLATAEEADRSPRIMKVIRLESYEDALNNLDLRRTAAQQSLLDVPEAQGADGLREDYLLRYMLDVETQGSQSLLNVAAFTDPRAYRLKVKRPGSDESREVNVDLLETFNWLVGLTVRHIAAPQTFSASFVRDNDPDLPADAVQRLLVDGRLREDPNGPWWFRTVTGTTPDGRRTLIVWRTRPGGETPDGVEQDNLVLDEWFQRQRMSPRDQEFDLIYVNGGNNLENLKTPDDTWKVRLIEEDFHRLMFDMEGV